MDEQDKDKPLTFREMLQSVLAPEVKVISGPDAAKYATAPKEKTDAFNGGWCDPDASLESDGPSGRGDYGVQRYRESDIIPER